MKKKITKNVKKILLPKDYIRFVITNEFATDVSDASGMQLLDIAKRDWSDEILKILDIDKTLLVKVYESIEISGYVSLVIKLYRKEIGDSRIFFKIQNHLFLLKTSMIQS